MSFGFSAVKIEKNHGSSGLRSTEKVLEILELCFDASARGSLRVAQHCGEGGAGAVGLIYRAVKGGASTQAEHAAALDRARRGAMARSREAVSLGGDPSDVLALSLGLDLGDIREPLGESRRVLMKSWYGGDREGDPIADRDWQRNLDAAARLAACGSGDRIRIWVDQTPHSACGLLHAASVLKGTGASVSFMLLPPWRERRDGTVVRYQGWGEVSPEEFGHFLHLERPLLPLVLRILADRWQTLQKENAPLRAIVNGRVRSVAETFYDDLIRRHLPAGETGIAMVIGEVLGRECPGIGDLWLAERIRWMLETGELRMVREDPERFYSSVVERA